MVSEAIDAAEKVQLLIGQWRAGAGTGLSDFMRELLSIVDAELVQPLVQIEAGASLDTAEGIFLDYIGERLGFSRPTQDDTNIERFGYRDSGGKGFDQAPFYTIDPQAVGRVPVGDEEYRSALRARAQALLGAANRTSLTAAGNELFDTSFSIERDSPASLSITAEDSRDEWGAVVANIYVDALGLPVGAARSLSVTAV